MNRLCRKTIKTENHSVRKSSTEVRHSRIAILGGANTLFRLFYGVRSTPYSVQRVDTHNRISFARVQIPAIHSVLLKLYLQVYSATCDYPSAVVTTCMYGVSHSSHPLRSSPQISPNPSFTIYRLTAVRNLSPTNTALSPSSSSILRIWFSLAKRSDLQGAPVLIWPHRSPTTISAMVTSSVSPDRCETITPHPPAKESFAAWIDSVRVPIWLTLSNKALHDFSSIAFLMRSGFVTVRSSLYKFSSGYVQRRVNLTQQSGNQKFYRSSSMPPNRPPQMDLRYLQ